MIWSLIFKIGRFHIKFTENWQKRCKTKKGSNRKTKTGKLRPSSHRIMPLFKTLQRRSAPLSSIINTHQIKRNLELHTTLTNKEGIRGLLFTILITGYHRPISKFTMLIILLNNMIPITHTLTPIHMHMHMGTPSSFLSKGLIHQWKEDTTMVTSIILWWWAYLTIVTTTGIMMKIVWHLNSKIPSICQTTCLSSNKVGLTSQKWRQILKRIRELLKQSQNKSAQRTSTAIQIIRQGQKVSTPIDIQRPLQILKNFAQNHLHLQSVIPLSTCQLRQIRMKFLNSSLARTHWIFRDNGHSLFKLFSIKIQSNSLARTTI